MIKSQEQNNDDFINNALKHITIGTFHEFLKESPNKHLK